MRLKEGFVIRKICGDTVAIFAGGDTVDLQQAIHLNETAELLFARLQNGAETDELVSALTEKYDIDKEKARHDVESFISRLAEKELLIL
jgi:hypothetical protein